MIPLTLDDLIGPWKFEPWTPTEIDNGRKTVAAWNTLAGWAEADGVGLVLNPATGCYIGGNGSGGARPKGSKVGAPHSKHQALQALDWYDPSRMLMRWILTYGLDRAGSLGMYFEHPQWTRSWCHGQIVAPGDGTTRWGIFFVPYADLAENPPTCRALLEQQVAAVNDYEFKAAA